MFLAEVYICWPAIYGSLIGAVLLSIVLGFIRRIKHKNIMQKISNMTHKEVLLKLQKMLTRPFPAMAKLERETIYLEIAIIYLLDNNYTEFNVKIEQISSKKLFFLKQAWLALYSYQIKNYDEFKKYQTTSVTIYSKFTQRYKTVYSVYNELLEELAKNYNEPNKERLEQIMNSITQLGGILLKEYIKQFS